MKRFLYLILFIVCVVSASSQAITGVIVPQVMCDTTRGVGENARTPYIIRAKLTGLTANTTYRYITRAVCLNYLNGVTPAADNATSAGAGNQIWLRQSGNFGYTAGTGLGVANGYDSLVTNSSGEYEGWFGLEPTANARFAPGNYIHIRIITNNGVTGNTTQTNYLTVTDSAKTTTYGTVATQGSGLYSKSAATDKNVVVLYDNTTGTGRPVGAAIVENDGIAYRSASSPGNYPLYYRNNVDSFSGAWGTIIPNNLANGIRRIENRKLSDGTLYHANTSTNGVWPTGSVNTVNTSAGYSALKIDSSDAPLVPPSPKFQFKATSITVAENVGTVKATVKYTSPAGTNTTVDVSLGLSSTATSGSDFTYTTPTTLTFAPADTELTVTLVITDDAVTESSENIVLRLKNPSNGAIFLNDSATITITDNDGMIVGFSVAKQTVSEGAGTLNVVTQLSKPATIAASVTLSAVTNTATTADYTFSSTVVNFAIGDSVKTSVVTITDDASVEGTENFTMQLSVPTNAILGTAVDSIFITDNDFRRYPIGQISTNDANGVADSLGKKYDEVGVVYGINYRPAGLQFVIRDNTGGITVFRTTGNHGYTVKEGDSVRVIGTVAQFNGLTEFNSDTVILLGTNKPIKTPVVATTLSETHENDLVRFNDVQFNTPIFTWPAGAANIAVHNATDTIIIRIQLANSDILGKPAPIGAFDIIGLGNQFDNSSPYNSGYQLFPRFISDVITHPAVLVDTTAMTVNENAGTVKVKLRIGQVNGQAVTVNLGYSGSATMTTDYTAPTSVTFPATAANGDSIMVNYTIVDDAAQEGNETIVTSFTGTGVTIFGATQTITISANDAPANATIMIDPRSVSVNENAGTVSMKAVITAVNGIAATATLAFSGSATAGTDYTAPSATITFPATAQVGDSIMVSYAITDDTQSENDETIITTYTAGSNCVISGPATDTITINKNDGFGIRGNANASNLMIYPNPSHGMITVESKETITHLTLYDMTGKMIQDQNSGSTSVRVSSLATGIYMLHVATATGQTVQRVVVQ